MSRLVQKGAARSKLHMEELKKTMARANYNLDSTQITEQLTTPTKNLETPISKPVTTSIEHFLDSRQQVRVSTNSKPSNKNLTLKEYIHLDSIEKSRKRKSVSSNSLMETGELIKGDKSLRVTKTRCNNLTSSQQMASQEFRYLETFKEEINKQIEEQIKRLKDLSHFINHDYEAGTYDKKSERVLFCNIHSALTDEADLHKKLGEQILKIQESDPQKLQRKNNKYFWETSHKQLTSPAKLKEGLEATGAAFMMFGLLETKGTDNK